MVDSSLGMKKFLDSHFSHTMHWYSTNLLYRMPDESPPTPNPLNNLHRQDKPSGVWWFTFDLVIINTDNFSCWGCKPIRLTGWHKDPGTTHFCHRFEQDNASISSWLYAPAPDKALLKLWHHSNKRVMAGVYNNRVTVMKLYCRAEWNKVGLDNMIKIIMTILIRMFLSPQAPFIEDWIDIVHHIYTVEKLTSYPQSTPR